MGKIKLNEKAPDFTLIDTEGKEFRLSEWKSKKWVYLVLNRGFAWPYTKKHLVQLHQDMEKFVEKETIIVNIGPEDRKTFEEVWKKNGFSFYGLGDEKKEVLKGYGQDVKALKLGRMPAQMIIDKEGILRYIHYGTSMQDIPENHEILTILEDFIRG